MARLPAAGAFRSLQSDDAAHDLPDFGTEPVEVPDGATLPPTPPDWVGRDPERSLPVVRVAERSEDSTSSVLDGMAEAADAAGQDAPESEPENSPTTFRDRLRAARERTGVRDEPGAPDIVAPRSSNLPAAIEAFIEGSAREHAAERRAGERAAVEASSAATGIPQSLRDLAARHGIQDPDRRLGEMDQATARALSAASDPRWWAELLRAVPEGAIDIGATTMRGAAVLGPIEAIATSVDRYRADILAVPGLSDAQVLELRQQVAREWGTRSPAVAAAIQHAITEMRAGTLTPESFAERYPPATPVQDRPLYRAGEATSAMGRQLLPAQPGYEQAVSRQLGHSLGSLLAGLPIAYFLGPVGGGTFFGMAGVGEATQRAVQFDQAERAAGREGLTQEQIILAGLLGVGPGATDIAPIEVMLGRLKLPGMTPQISRTIAQAIGRAGGRIFVQAGVEGGQEGLQQFLQNLISWSTYNPGQDLTDDVLRSFGLGTGVGGIAQAGRELGGGAIRLARRGGRGSASDGHPPAADAPPAPQQRPQTEPPLQPDGAGAPTAPAADAGVVSDDPYNLERFGGPVPETAAPAESEQSSAPGAVASEDPQTVELERVVDENISAWHADMEAVRQARRISTPLTDDDVRSVARHMARENLDAEEALERYAIEQYETERTQQEARGNRPQAAEGEPSPDFSAAQELIDELAAGRERGAAAISAEGASSDSAGARAGGPEPAPMGIDRAEPTTPAASDTAGGAERSIRPGRDAGSIGEQSRLTPALRARFNNLLAGGTPVSQWVDNLRGVAPEIVQVLIDEGVASGLLRIGRNGEVRRTTEATSAQGTPSTHIPTWDEITALLPRDVDGFPDVQALQNRLREKFGKDAFSALTQPEKAELYEKLDEEFQVRTPETPNDLYVISDHRGRDAARAAFRMGRSVVLDEVLVDATLEAIAPLLHTIPPDIKVGALARIDHYRPSPIERADLENEGRAPYNAIFTFRQHDGSTYTERMHIGDGNRNADGLDLRAVFSGPLFGYTRPDLPASVSVLTFGTEGVGAGQFLNSLRSHFAHEGIHALRNRNYFRVREWSALRSVAHGLGILDLSFQEWSRRVGRLSDRPQRIGAVYRAAYAHLPPQTLNEALDQEAVAFLMDGYINGVFTDKQLGPAKRVLDAILAGDFGREAETYAGKGAIHKLVELAGGEVYTNERLVAMQAALEARLNAEWLKAQKVSTADIEAITGLRALPEGGWDVTDAAKVLSSAGRGPYLNTISPQEARNAALDVEATRARRGNQVRAEIDRLHREVREASERTASPGEEAIAERTQLGIRRKDLHALVAQARRDGADPEVVADLASQAIEEINADTSLELSVLEQAGSSLQEAQTALDALSDMRDAHAGLQSELYAIKSRWSEADVQDLITAELEEGERKRKPIPAQPVDRTKKLFDKRGDPIDRIMREMRQLEKSMMRDGKTAGEVAVAIRDRFGFDVDVAQIAAGQAWYRIDELLGESAGTRRVPWTPKHDQMLKEAWDSGLSVVAITETLRKRMERPRLASHAVVARAMQLGFPKHARANYWNAEMDQALLSPEIRNLKAAPAAEAMQTRFPGNPISNKLVSYHRRRLGQQTRKYYSDAAIAFMTSPEGHRIVDSNELAAALSKIEGRSIDPKLAIAFRKTLKDQGRDVGTRTFRSWPPEQMEALSEARAADLSYKEIIEMFRTKFDRTVTYGQVGDRLQVLKRQQQTPAVEHSIAALDAREDGAQLMASFARGPDDGDASVRGLRDIISDLKAALGMTTTQGRQDLTLADRAGGRRWRLFAPRDNQGQYDRAAGVARIPVSTDIEAIAAAGGRHVERLFGAPMATLLQTHADELGVAAAPDTPLPQLSPQGFSGLDLDGETQAVLIGAAEGLQAWRAMMADRAARRRDPRRLEGLASRTAIATRTLERRLGKTIAGALIADLIGDATKPNGGVLSRTPYRQRAEGLDPLGTQHIDPARLADYVRERYSATGVPAQRQAIAVPDGALSDGFARFFSRYVTDPDAMRREMPGFYKAFEDFLDANDPGLLETLERLQLVLLSSEYQAYKQATTLARGRADLVSNADQRLFTRIARVARAATRAETFTSIASQIYMRAVAEEHPVALLTRRLLEQADANKIVDADGRAMSLAVHENPAKLIRSIGDSFKTGLRWLQDGMPRYRHRDSGFAVKDAAGVVVQAFPNRAAADAFVADAGPGVDLRIEPVSGSRSQSIHQALALAKAWDDHATYRDFGLYLESRRAIEEWKRWEAQGSAPQADGQGLQREPHRVPRVEHEERVRRLEALHPGFVDGARAVYDFVWASAVHDFEAGRLSQAELDYRETRRHFFVPFARDVSEVAELGVRGMRARLRRFTRDMAFRGSSRDIIHPIETIIDQAFHRAGGTFFNDFAASIANLAQRVGPGGAAIAERVTRTDMLQANDVGFRELQQRLQDMGHQAEDARDLVKRIEADFGDTQLLLQSTAPTAGRALMIPLWEGGQRNYLRINDPDFAQDIWATVNGMGRELSSLLVDFMAAPATLLRAGVTTNPAFVGPNIVRDSWSAWLITGALPIYTQAKGLYHELFQTDVARLYQEAAGILGGQNVNALSKVRDKTDVMAMKERGLQIKPVRAAGTALVGGTAGFMLAGPVGAGFGALVGGSLHKGIRQFIPMIAHLSDMSETATRLGVFDKAYKASLVYNPHLTPYEAAQDAAFVARDLIDFGRRGSRMLAVSRVITFINASIQSLDKAARTLLAKSDRGSAISTTKLTALIAAGAATGLVAGPLVGTSLALAAPVAATNLAARSAAMRALLAPFVKKDHGLPLSREEERALSESAKTWTRLLGTTLLYVAISALWFDNEEYRRFRTDVRGRMQPLHPMEHGEWFGLPKAWEWGVPSNIMEAAIDAQFRNDPRFWERVRETVYDNMTPPGTAQILTLYRDIGSGQDSFRQRPLVPPNRRTLPPEEQFNAYSSQLAIAMSRYVNARPWLRSAIESAGSTVFRTEFELSPAVIDHILRTGLGHWGADLQRASDVTTLGGSRVRDYPLVGGLLGRFIMNSARSNDQMELFYEVTGADHRSYLRAASGYQQRLTAYRDGPQQANAFLATLETAEERAYALLEATGTTFDRRQHPLKRLRSIVDVTHDMESDIALRRFGDSTDPLAQRPIVLTPDQRVQVRQALALVRTVEANNAFVALGIRQFASLNQQEVKPAIDLLRSISRPAFLEYQRRLDGQNVEPSFTQLARNWTRERDRLLREWQRAVDRDAAIQIERRRRRIPLPIGASEPPAEIVPPLR